MTSSTFTWQNEKGLKRFGREWRPAGDPRGVVVLVHGIGEHTGRYNHVGEALNAAGFGMIGFDLPGHGQTEGPRGHTSYDAISDDIGCFFVETGKRYPNLPLFLYGHSLGGALVLYYALTRRPQIKGVIATSPGLVVGEVPAWKVFVARVMARLSPGFTMENGLDLNYLTRDQTVIAAYKKDPLVHPKVSALLGWDLLSKGPWIIEHAPEFPLPLLLVQGSADHLISPQATAAFAKAAPQDKITYKVWEGMYHETHNEPEKQKVLQYMIDWLNAHL